ncbi:MAG: hypothetical protein EBQ80_00230 [Proteobacteria bacterium]|nr:hypothetical protein [Pseudomonadota bacterium]
MMLENDFADWETGEDAFPLDNAPLTGDSRTEARICAIQVVFQALVLQADVADMVKEFSGLNKRKADRKLFKLLTDELALGLPRYTTMVQAELREEWPWARLQAVLRAILLVAAAEMTVNPSVGMPILANEYVNIGKGFLAADEVAFVHKMLEILGKKVRG